MDDGRQQKIKEKTLLKSGKKLDFAYTVNISFQILAQPRIRWKKRLQYCSIIVREYFIDGGNIVKKKKKTEGKKLKGIEKSKRHCHMQLHTFWYNKSRIKLKSTVKTIVREMHEFFRYDESIWTRIRFKKDISIGAFSICTALQHFIIIHSGVFFHLFLCFFQ